MMLKRIFALLLVLVTAAAALAEDILGEFIEDYNYYALQNSAPLIDSALTEQSDGDWLIYFDGEDYALYLSFDDDGLIDLLMLDTAPGLEGGLRAFLNVWFVADSAVEYDEIFTLVNLMMASGTSAVNTYQGWYVAYERVSAEDSDTGAPRDMIGIVWTGDDGDIPDTDEITFPDSTPSTSKKQNEAETYNGKPVYKA